MGDISFLDVGEKSLTRRTKKPLAREPRALMYQKSFWLFGKRIRELDDVCSYVIVEVVHNKEGGIKVGEVERVGV